MTSKAWRRHLAAALTACLLAIASAPALADETIPFEAFWGMWVKEGGIDTSDRQVLERYAAARYPKAWREVDDNEFKRDDFLDRMRAEIEAFGEIDWRTLEFETVVRLEYNEYDTERGGFPVAAGRRTAVNHSENEGGQFLSARIYFPQLAKYNFVPVDEAAAQRIRAQQQYRREFWYFVRWQPKAVLPSRERIVANIKEVEIFADKALSQSLLHDTLE